VTSIGCFVWGACTAGFSTCRSLRQGYAFWAINGVGLSLVIPTGQSLIADYYHVRPACHSISANAMSKELASTLASALLPIVLRFGPYLLAIGQLVCKLTQLHKEVGVSGHHCIAQHLG